LIIPWLVLPVLSSAQPPYEESTAPARIDQIMQARYAAGDFNGTVLVARKGKVIYERGFGLANREWNIANDLQTKFEIGSMTKQFTVMLVLQLVNEGKIRLDDGFQNSLHFPRRRRSHFFTE